MPSTWHIEHILLQYFIKGLEPIEMHLIDAYSGGALLDKTQAQLRALITSIADDTKYCDQEEDWYVDTPQGFKKDSTSRIETQLAE